MAEQPADEAAGASAPHDAAGTAVRYPVDAKTISTTCAEIIRAQPDGDHPALGLLVGHLQLLVLEVEEAVPRMRDDRQEVARYTISASYGLLREYEAGEAVAYPMAIQCRELLRLHQRPGPLAPVPASEVGT
ncbi:hypothetical protein [Streptomyces acidiscabies]|uniref:hypothetical protein n=1 Tax=Streptomyces acidiscabies TaxID=42234 RepID=UPI0038F68F0C